jgi:hypothetical protein
MNIALIIIRTGILYLSSFSHSKTAIFCVINCRKIWKISGGRAIGLHLKIPLMGKLQGVLT